MCHIVLCGMWHIRFQTVVASDDDDELKIQRQPTFYDDKKCITSSTCNKFDEIKN